MTLPTMPGLAAHREYLRVGGGFGAQGKGTSPAGGLDADHAGNLAMDGDLTVGGALDLRGGTLSNSAGGLSVAGDLSVAGTFALAAGGVNRAWSAWLGANDGLPSGVNPASGPNSWALRADRQARTLDFGSSEALIDATFFLLLPPDYDGAELQFDLYWTANAGTSGSVVWQASCCCADDGGDASQSWSALGSAIDAFQGTLVQHRASIARTPAQATAGNAMYVLVRRNGPHASDTFDGTARLQGIRVRYA